MPACKGDLNFFLASEPGAPRAHRQAQLWLLGLEVQLLAGGNQSLSLELAFLSQSTKNMWLCNALFGSL